MAETMQMTFNCRTKKRSQRLESRRRDVGLTSQFDHGQFERESVDDSILNARKKSRHFSENPIKIR
jgi:hypothetical protein